MIKFLLCIQLLFFGSICNAQKAYKVGDLVADLPAENIINYSNTSATLSKLQSNITIIDFFGTWCVPCVKALPKLAAFQTKYSQDLNTVLVSNESEKKITDFISKRKPFIFPIVIDGENTFTNVFQPPSYPYTIVLDKNRKILIITNAEDITEEMLVNFIKESKAVVKQTNTETYKKPKTEAMPAFTKSENKLALLSQNFMYAAKTGDDVTADKKQLKNLSYDSLVSEISTDDLKKAFWINLYNAYTYSALKQNPDQYKNRKAFFKNKNIEIAGKRFSLDKIEHGFLRRSKIKWSLGYLNKFFPSKTEKQLRVSHLDYRIHFALNCGAKSCPPIAFYNPENIDTQLDIATTAYLTGEVEYDESKNIVHLPALLNWFRRDFGGKKNIIKLLKTKQLIPEDKNPKIEFKKYDWSVYLDNFKK
jgi:thiol-disulfide isomerase/thioredoxin